MLRTVPTGQKPVWLLIKVPGVECRSCGCIRQINLGIAEPRRCYTKAFERHVLDLLRCMTIKDVADLLGVGRDCVKDIYKRYLATRYSRPKLAGLRYLAIDEICVGKGHKYPTLVMDLQRGAVVFVGEGKGGDALKPFREALRRSRAKIRAVATDMSAAYISAVLEHLPGVPLVFDHFHVVKLMNECLTEVRRKLFHELTNVMDKKVLKGTRWLLLKNPENLNEEKNEPKHLQEALRLNEPLMTAYYLKEDLRQFRSQPNKETAAQAIQSLMDRAMSTGIGPLMKMARTIATYRFGILAWYDHRISSGPMEGTNNKIRVMQRQAYGFRDQEFFKLRIFTIHTAKYALTG
jgi:transposase